MSVIFVYVLYKNEAVNTLIDVYYQLINLQKILGPTGSISWLVKEIAS